MSATRFAFTFALQIGQKVISSCRMKQYRDFRNVYKLFQARPVVRLNSRNQLTFLAIFPGIKLALCARVNSVPAATNNVDELLRTADMFYEKNQMKELFELLDAFKESDQPELLWRLARAHYEMAKLAKTDKEKEKLTCEAFALSEKALLLDERNYACHKWFAILLDEVGKFKGIKYRLQRSPEVKEHFERSIQLNPRDPTSHHCLGFWHYSFADLAWYQRKAAQAFFATPPTSSYREAIKCFEEAEKVQPNFYSMNLLMLAKSYKKLQDYQTAGLWLHKLHQMVPKTREDIEAKTEGRFLSDDLAFRESKR